MRHFKTEYTLIKSVTPTIVGNNVVYDEKVGGEKLVYKQVIYPVKRIRIRNGYIEIPGIIYLLGKLDIPINKNITTCVFLRPFKKYYSDQKKGRLFPHDWGKKDHPLTNLWLEMDYDYKDIISTIPMVKNVVEDPDFKKFLRRKTTHFVINQKNQ